MSSGTALAATILSSVAVILALTRVGYLLTHHQHAQPDAADPSHRGPGPLIGGCLIAAAGLTLVATFVPIERAVPHKASSLRIYDGLHYGAIVWFLEIGLLAAIGCVAIRRTDRIRAAFVVGYSAPAIGAIAYYAAAFSVQGSDAFRLGPAYYVLDLGAALDATALLLATAVVLTGSRERPRADARRVGLGVLAALLVASASTMRLTHLPGLSLWQFSPLPSRFVPPTVVIVFALALVPLLAIRLGDRAASYLVSGLAVWTALSVAGVVFSRFGNSQIPDRLTVGFWLTVGAVAALVVLAASLRQRAYPPAEFTPIPAAVA